MTIFNESDLLSPQADLHHHFFPGEQFICRAGAMACFRSVNGGKVSVK